MTHAESAAHPESEVERLLCSLSGVVSARVITNPLGRLDEIHILASDTLHPKQVVRNVESALSAGLGIVIDRRVVSVAQVRADQYAPLLDVTAVEYVAPASGPALPAAGSPLAPPPEPESGDLVTLAENRYMFVGYDVRNQTNRETICHVTIGRGNEHYTGSGTGASTVLGRAQAAARGLFAALATARDAPDLLLENAAVVHAHGHTYVLVAAHGMSGRQTDPLTGAALLQRAPEEAAILAGLQAVNRWAGENE